MTPAIRSSRTGDGAHVGVRAGWRIVARQELVDLWGGVRGLAVLFAYSVLLAVLGYLASADAGINLLDARESVGVITQTAIALGALCALVISADAISGERERGTLEALLVSPLRRRDLVVGKLASSSTMWVAAQLVALPFILVMAKGPGIAVDALAALALGGSLVAAALTALGLAISSVAMSNRTSLAAAVATMLILAVPSQLPSVTAKGFLGSILIRLNPVSAGLELTNEVLVNQRSWGSQWTLLISPTVAAIVLTTVAIGLSGRIELGDSR
jgi:ABC-2 type transport system permease protein